MMPLDLLNSQEIIVSTEAGTRRGREAVASIYDFMLGLWGSMVMHW